MSNLTGPDLSDGISPEAIRAEAGKILATDSFKRSERSRRFLEAIVDHHLAGNPEPLKEYTLALQVFDRKASFDPRLDPIVRVEAGRLRNRLKAYYEGQGRQDSIQIDLPLRSYTPVFRRQIAVPPAPEPFANIASTPVAWRRAKALLLIAPVILLLAAGAFWYRSAALLRPSPNLSITVVPFKDLDAGASEQHFAEHVTEELIEALSHVAGIRILPGQAPIGNGTGEKARMMQQPGGEFILEGSVRMAAGRMRVIARLIDGNERYRLWSKAFAYDRGPSLSLEQEIAGHIVDELRQRLGVSFRSTFAERRSSKPEAHQEFLKGIYYSHSASVPNLRKALEVFERAVALDPGYAAAWSGIADVCLLLARYGDAPDVIERARSSAQRAIQLDGELANAHASLAFVRAIYDRDWVGAREGFRRAHELDPGDALIHEAWVSGYLVPSGDLAEALKQIEEAQQFDPTSARVMCTLGNVHYFRREYDRAISKQRQALELDPSFFPANLALAEAYTQKGMFSEASLELEKWKTAVKDSSAVGMRSYGLTFSRSHEDALTWLEEACRRRSPLAIYMGMNPRFDALQSQARFRTLLKITGLSVPDFAGAKI